MGCLAIGLGAADVLMTLTAGGTWFKIPESTLIELRDAPAFGVMGKDVILYTLKELRRYTADAERTVEFVCAGVQFLSVDAPFATSNL